MKTIFYFVRHGRTIVNIQKKIQGRCDNLLSNEGKEDAKLIAEFIKKANLRIDKIISSPLSRAYETAQIINNNLNLNLDIDTHQGLIERDFGSAENLEMTLENLTKVINDDFENLEKSSDLCFRTKNTLLELLNKYEGKNILVTCHSHVIKSIFMQYDQNIKFDTLFGHNSISILEFENKTIKKVKFNIRDINNI